MDPVSQGALGAACAQICLYPSDKKNVWIAGMIAGMAPDLDILLQSPNDPMFYLLYHRQLTHSVLFIPAGGLLVFLALQLFSRFRAKRKIILMACLIGYASHGLLDAFTIYGTVLWWPFSYDRIAFDVLSIIDPFITFPLVLGVIWTQVFDTRKGVVVGLLLASMTLFVNIIQHQRADHVIQRYQQKNNIQLNKIRILPNFASSTSWRALGFDQNKLYLFQLNVSLLSKANILSVVTFKAFRDNQIPSSLKHAGQQYRDYQIFKWFSDDYLVATSHDPLILVDGRYINGNPLRALWGIKFQPDSKHILRVRNILIPNEVINP